MGCNACVQRCPKQCITMHEDEQGFLYPSVELDLCINCNLCEKVCPVINQAAPREPLETFAGENPDDEVRMSSSSGGIFYALAKMIIDKGGVVFGAKFNEQWEVVHDFTETLEGIKAFQGSKYVQSRIGNTFQQAESFLKDGRKVMFTGTPCQIASLNLFLRKDYGKQLLKVDVICHGVPSPVVWREYLKYITRPKEASDAKNTFFTSLKGTPVITDISFRDKRLGWEKYGFSVHVAASQASGEHSGSQSADKRDNNSSIPLFQLHNENPYFWAFNYAYILRPSCFACPAKSCKSGSNITIGDFWNIKKKYSDIDTRRGISLIMVHNKEMSEFICKNLIIRQTDYNTAVHCVQSIVKPAKKPTKYDKFWKFYNTDGVRILNSFFWKYRISKKQKFIINPVKKMLGKSLVQTIKKYLRK